MLTGGVSAAAGAPSPASEQVQVRISSEPVADSAFLSHPRIRILVNGRTVLDAAVPGCGRCKIDIARDLSIVDFDGDGHYDVALRLRTGEGECCMRLDVFERSGRSFVPAARNFYTCGVSVRDLDGDGRAEVVACDPRFDGRFADAADSRAPLRVWRFAGGRFGLATRLFPGALRADAGRAWKAFRARRGERDVRGVLAAWTADELLLGNARTAWRQLEALRRGGVLTGDGGPQGAAYLGLLRRQLLVLGYRS